MDWRHAVRIPGLGVLKFTFWVMYFIQKMSNNVEGISKMPVVSQLKNPTGEGGFGLAAEQLGSFRADAGMGWYVKALFGPVVDNLPIFGYRRKSWLILSSLLASMAWAWVALFGQSTVSLLFIGIMFVNVFIALGDVVCDGMMVEMSQRLEAQYRLESSTVNRGLQSAQWFGGMTAITIGAIGGGIIAQFFQLRSAALVSGLMPMILVMLVAFAVTEEKVAWDSTKARKGFRAVGIVLAVAAIFYGLNHYQPPSWATLLMPLVKTGIVVGAMSMVVRIPRQLFVPAGFMVLWFALPFNLDGGYCVRYFTIDSSQFLDRLRSTDGAMGWLWQMLVATKATTQEKLDIMLTTGNGLADLYYGSVLGALGALGGVFGALVFMTRRVANVPLHRILFACLFTEALVVAWFSLRFSTMTPVHLLVFGFTGTGLSVVVLLGALSFGAAVIPNRDQAALYAFLMSMSNIGQQYGTDVVGGKIYDWAGKAQKVTDAAGQQSVVMGGADSGMRAVCAVSLGVLAATAMLVSWLHRSSKLTRQVKG